MHEAKPDRRFDSNDDTEFPWSINTAFTSREFSQCPKTACRSSYLSVHTSNAYAPQKSERFLILGYKLAGSDSYERPGGSHTTRDPKWIPAAGRIEPAEDISRISR